MERAFPGGGRSFQFNGRTLRGLAYRLHRQTCYTKKEALRRISRLLKVAATYSPTTQCSTIGDAVSLPLSLSAALAPLRSLSRARAPQARTAHTPHGSLRAHTAPHSATPPPMRHTQGGKRRLFLTGKKRYGLSQKRSIGLSFFRATAGRTRV